MYRAKKKRQGRATVECKEAVHPSSDWTTLVADVATVIPIRVFFFCFTLFLLYECGFPVTLTHTHTHTYMYIYNKPGSRKKVKRLHSYSATSTELKKEDATKSPPSPKKKKDMPAQVR
jgi:hypothetical protein